MIYHATLLVIIRHQIIHAEMRDEAATPGGLNEQSLRSLTGSEHFRLAEQVSQNGSDVLECIRFILIGYDSVGYGYDKKG